MAVKRQQQQCRQKQNQQSRRLQEVSRRRATEQRTEARLSRWRTQCKKSINRTSKAIKRKPNMGSTGSWACSDNSDAFRGLEDVPGTILNCFTKQPPQSSSVHCNTKQPVCGWFGGITQISVLWQHFTHSTKQQHFAHRPHC